jgi:hypothetical protein
LVTLTNSFTPAAGLEGLALGRSLSHSTGSFAHQLAAAIEQVLGGVHNGSRIEIDFNTAPGTGGQGEQLTITLKDLGASLSASAPDPNSASGLSPDSAAALNGGPQSGAGSSSSGPAAGSSAAPPGSADSASSGAAGSAGSGAAGSVGGGSAGSVDGAAVTPPPALLFYGANPGTPHPAPPEKNPLPSAADVYWAAQPPAVQALRNIPDEATRYAEAKKLAENGYVIDGAIMVALSDPLKTMQVRQELGYTWVPSLLQPPVEVPPGVNFPWLKNYDPNNPPPGSIKVTTAFAAGSADDPAVTSAQQSLNSGASAA